MPNVTVFTPTFNREKKIDRLYQSLRKQTSYDFEWIVVDDGSSDETDEYFQRITSEEKKFEIKYIKTSNGGKHRAVNLGLDLARGEYFFIVDSDDYLSINGIELIVSWINNISGGNEELIGVVGLKGYENGKIVGKTFKGEVIDCNSLERYKYNIKGDKAEVLKTSIFKRYKFPEFEDEKFLTESVVWNRIAKDGYKFRYFNEIIYICEYLEDGLTNNIDYLYSNNFKGYSLYIKEFLCLNTSYFLKLKLIMAYGYRGRITKKNFMEMSKGINVHLLKLYILTNIGIFYKRAKFICKGR